MTELTLINIHPKKYSQEIYYYAFAVSLVRYVGMHVQHDYRYKRIKKINKAYFIQM